MAARITYLFLLLSCNLLAQDAKVVLSINPTNIEVGEVFSITITSNTLGSIEIENLPASFIQDYDFKQGTTQEMDYNTGDYTETHFVTYTGMITKSGNYTIGPAWVKTGSKAIPSNKVELTVSKKLNMSYGNVTAQQLNDPAFGVIECNKKEIYEGEALLVSAKIYSQFDPSHISSYQSYPINSTVLKHPVGNSNNIKVVDESFRGKKLRAFSYDKNVIFPDAVGSFQIDPFKLNLHQNYRSFPITSSGLKVNVKPLPANPPSDFIGAVGHFEVNCSVDTNRLLQGDVVKFTLTIRGTGNLHNLIDPKLSLPKGFIVYGDPVPTENFVITSRGADGEVSYEFNLQLTGSGKMILPATTITYFDPELEKYVQVRTKDLEFDVKKNSSFRVQEVTEDGENSSEMIVHNTSIRLDKEQVSQRILYGSGLFWTGVGLPIFTALIFVLFIKRRKDNEEHIKEKVSRREKENDLTIELTKLSTLSEGDDLSAFFSSLDQLLRLCTALELGAEDHSSVSKTDIIDLLKTKGFHESSEKVKELFNLSESIRYGFAAERPETRKIYDEILTIIKQIRS